MSLTLTEVKALLRERHRASLGEIALHFGSNPEAVRQALGHWQAKGRVRRLDGGACASGCHCAMRTEEVYEWVGEANPAPGGCGITPGH
ncbi:hypothetical protein A6A04_11680 [Paramagnetospirillum marisnigri]|uniref:Transcriptional regulator HTH-type FeoC domain-containing protein n=1 Tax=Paramagnetospirillum marisnigri TaxID=1285242 RepID=A0A178MVS9_9PROT|nr:FeoC-like transcriptional regulator [Paramagnetospirillum marisnigri]OAN54581.1 hypothetical protein A6A04_11680 [Paramagnetospirillum marisnigri]